MTAHTCRTDSLSVAEPLGGTAPTESRLLIVEQPGPWGSAAVQESRMVPLVREKLEQLENTKDIKVFLARRQDRKRLDDHRNVWFMRRVGRRVAAGHFQIPEDSPISLPEVWLPESSPSPVLFICTNGARDQCCAVEGRRLIRLLGVQVWEISHLGGHRFAPTAIRFPDGLLFGRLSATSAVGLVSGRSPEPSHIRGRFGRSSWQQVAELMVSARTGILLHELDSSGDPASTTVSDDNGASWEAKLSQRDLEPRRVSCNRDPVTDRAWAPSLASST